MCGEGVGSTQFHSFWVYFPHYKGDSDMTNLTIQFQQRINNKTPPKCQGGEEGAKGSLTLTKRKSSEAHMKREHFHVLVRHRIYLLGQLDYMEQRQFDCNKCNFIFEKLNTFHTQMKIQHGLALAGLDN